MFCSKCGNQIKDGFKFCPKCGAPVYVNKEAPDSEVKKEEVEEVANETKVSSDNDVVLVNKAKNTKETESTPKAKKEIVDPTSNEICIPNPMILEELDIEGVMKKAKQGDKAAMLRQAFRYEMGIGTVQDFSKADELYKKLGGKSELVSLEQAHINTILPDPNYDSSFLPFSNPTNSLLIPTYVKDLILDYYYNVECCCSNNPVPAEIYKRFQDIFIKRMKEVRGLHPELFLVYINDTITEEEANDLFNIIKKNSSNRFSMKWFPSMHCFYDIIDGLKVRIPSVYKIESDGAFTITYENENDRIKLLNQFVFSIMLQLPIKKVKLNFVDLGSKYEYDKLLRQLPPVIYDERPIISEEQLECLLNRLEERKLNVIKNYGNYPKYCDDNQEIPIPYEFVFFFDDSMKCKYEKRIMQQCSSTSPIGIYYVLFKNNNGLTLNFNEKFDSDRNEIISNKQRSYQFFIRSGLFFIKTPNHLMLEPEDNIVTNEDKCFNWASYLPGILSDKVDNKQNIKRHVSYELIFAITKFNGENYLIDNASFELFNNKLQSLYGIEKIKISDLISKKEKVLLKYSTKEEATGAKTCLIPFIPKVKYQYHNRIRLIPYHSKNKTGDMIGIALYIPRKILRYNYFEKDLLCYMSFFDYQIDYKILNHFKEILERRYVGCSYTSDYFPNSYNSKRCLHLNDKPTGYILDEQYNGYIISKFLCYQYNMDFGFWGFNGKNPQDMKIAIDALTACELDIEKIERELDKFAIKKWGVGYEKDHLAFKDEVDNVAFLSLREKCEYRIPVFDYDKIEPDSIIKPVNLVDDKQILTACLKYINQEIMLKDEHRAIITDFNKFNRLLYDDISNGIYIDVGRKGKDEMQFYLNLVSHVHSFIIGQSGSGKSVFLHNIIGGAMLKYAPEDLQLYLLDFKLGGVEFNRYKGAKHVKALLVDNSDPQVTLEILRELRGSMTERGKLLRSAGVNNIGEYNKIHQQDRIPHVLVVADECHEMFKADDSIPRLVRNEISDIVIKIAKEGRSQGVHLVFATQTLSGTEISSEIINNVSDFYLLKCAQTDSERLVPNSSAITSELSTGQIYYHHVDEQVKFQAYYTDKQMAEKLIATIVEKANDHKSNGEFYFNGAQMFYMDEAVKELMQTVKGKSPVAFMGKAIDISQKDLYIKLNEDFSENVLLLGLNDQEQVTRTTMNLFVSLMMSAKLKHKDIAFKVIDCLNNEEGEVHELIFDLENEGYCDIIERRQRSKFFKELAQSIQNGTAGETILMILGQDRFRELKMDLELEDGNDSKSSDDDMMSISDDFFGDSSSSSSKIRTYRDALNVILDKGPDYGVHTLLQIEKASNLLFEDYITPKVVFQKFKHLVMLKSDETAGVTLHLNDDIRLEKLSSDWDRLRAYYYSEESDSYTLFTPYMPSKSKEIINILNTL